jgi:hypothetical protein
MVGDTASAALVAADGTLDWWCPARFDAAPLFSRLVEPTGPCLRVGPAAPGRPPVGTQAYQPATLVLVTRLEGRESVVDVTDAMPWDGGRPAGRLVRLLRVRRGPADIAIDLVPGPGEVSLWSEGVAFGGTVVRCPVDFVAGSAPPPAPARLLRRPVVSAAARLDTGAALVVTVDPPGAHGGPLSPDAAERLLERTRSAWRRVVDSAVVEGPFVELAARSIVVLRALSPAGAPVSSPATSLPRLVGGERNTDGRVVRPATAAGWAGAAAAIGLAEESDAAVAWLAAAVEQEPPLPSALAPDGSAPPTEAPLTGLSGWRHSEPVVSGTNAPDRRTAEPASAVVAAAAALGGELEARWDRVVTHADWIADRWHEPDATAWDLRGPPRPWVAPRLAVRDALVRAADAARRRDPLDLSAAAWTVSVRAVERWLLRHGLTSDGVLRSAADDGADPEQWDVGVCRAAWLGPWPPGDAVVRSTVDRITSRNTDGPWLVPWPADVDDGLPGTEPPSVAATLWMARALALAGEADAAHERVEAVATLGEHLGLLPESFDARGGLALGNRPSAEAHVAFLEAVLTLDQQA